MASDDGERQWENVVEVTEARQKGAGVVVTFRDPSDGEGDPYRYEVSDLGVYKVKGGGVGASRYCQLKLPFTKGATWESTAKNDYGDNVTIRFTSTAVEEIEVPAGKFRCLRIDSEFEVRGTSWKGRHWMAPRVGTVKHVVVGKDDEGKLTDYVCVGVLKSFTPGGK